MDRGKPTQSTRGPKAKISQQLPDSFIALGAKPGTSRDDPKRVIPLPKSSVGSSSSGKLIVYSYGSVTLTLYKYSINEGWWCLKS